MNKTLTTYKIDAATKSLGRVASEAAKALMGKTSPDYTPNIRSNVKVFIANARKLSIPESKRLQKTYTTYSGFPGGLKKENVNVLGARKGHGELLRRAIMRMLPRNTMRVGRMKNLSITE